MSQRRKQNSQLHVSKFSGRKRPPPTALDEVINDDSVSAKC